ncbi:unnamed protein product [Mytilus coruscus]|uniref:Uncharacterized protein n=1 Tax=Mytilus coruscus TaxID=42192 RepID=A0A6J8AE88_MYTCO|nr:unnamed protein product [Mytilus coruscus]
MPSIRNHKGQFSQTKSAKKITKLILDRHDRVQQKHKNNNRVSDHSYATFCNPVTPTENITASTFTDDDLTYIPPDLVPLSHCRLVTELDTLANQLKGCRECSIPLHLHDPKGVRCYGLTGIVYIICQNSSCQTLNRIKLGKVHFGREKKGVGIFYVNTKAATESPYFGMPASIYFGMPASRYVGMPASGYFGMPASGYVGMPASGYVGMPASGYVGMPASPYTGMPESQYFGMLASKHM